MNTQNRVFNAIKKQEKVELATQKVELALIDDVNNLYEKGFDLYDVQSELLKAQGKVKKSKTFFEQSQKVAADALEKSKELGASDFIKLFNTKIADAKDAIKSADNLISAIDKAITIL